MFVTEQGTASGTALEVLRVATRLGLTSFGGPIAHVGYFRREYVDRRRWLDDATYADLVALCQFLPGPASSQLGIAIGMRRAGIAGGLAAWAGFTLPSAIALVAFALLAGSVDLANAGWVHGLKLAAVSVVAQAVFLMARRLTPDWRRRAMAILAATGSIVIATPPSQLAIIAAGAVIGWLFVSLPPQEGRGADPASTEGARVTSRRLGAVSLGLFFLLLVTLPLAHGPAGGPGALVDAFYRAGALVFGGGHVVLPLLHASVVEPGWVSNDQFLAGYGMAQAVPGPLFSFAAYLGTVASTPPGGPIGGLVALIAIYVPSFLLILGVMPVWHRLRASVDFRRALAGTNAAVVGILLAALYTPVATSAIGTPADVVVAAIGLAALATGRIPPIAVVAAAAISAQLLTVVPV